MQFGLRSVRVRSVVGVTVAAVLATGLGVIAPTPAAAASSLSLTKEGPGQVLVGSAGEFTLTVLNTGDAPAYNVSFRDVLPAGVSYKPGSVSPASAGAPTILANKPATGQTTLIWSNTFDLNPNGEAGLTYEVNTDAASLPVGASFTNTAGTYWSGDPRTVPDFNATSGVFVPESGVIAVEGVAETTSVTAVLIEKSEPSPENELVRGIHGDNGTTYTLVVTNNGRNPTTGVTVTDYLPASLEYLQCGLVDNTSGDFVEYAGAPRLTATTAPLGSDCRTPTSVETVLDPVGKPAGVYTKVTWTVPDLAANSTYTITYRAGVPLQQNTMVFATRPAGSPVLTPSGTCSGGVCPQAANLDNNTGASTIETEGTQTNYAAVAGTYQGEWYPPSGTCSDPDDPTPPCPAPVPVSDSTEQTVTVEDLAMQKSVTPETFTVGGTATYTVDLQTSEYRSSEDITAVDILPDGLRYVSGSTEGDASLTSAVGTGPTTLTFAVSDIAADGTATFSFQATMQDAYSATGRPTVAGDEYENRISLTGTTYPIPNEGVAPPDPAGARPAVVDASSATITSGGQVIDKSIGQNRSVTTCADNTYAGTAPTFWLGDKVCFQLRVTFNAGNNTKNPFVTDFLPAELTYIPDSWAVVSPTNTVTNVALSPDSTSQVLTWTMGETISGSRYVDHGQVFLVQFAARVNSYTVGSQPDVTGNLMKFGSVNTLNEAVTLRDQLDLNLAASQIAIDKSIYQINGSPVPPNARGVLDSASVKAGDVVTWRVDLRNSGAAGSPPIRNLVVTDTLPTGITCDDISVTPSNPDPSPPAWTCASGVVTWDPYAGPISANTWATYPLLLDMTMPTATPVNTTYTNTARTTSYQVQANTGEWSTVTRTVSNTSRVSTRNVAVAKSVTTSFEGTNNDIPAQATVGETVTYTVDMTVPEKTTVRSASLSDTLPTGLQFVSSTATYAPDAGTPVFGELPDGVTKSGNTTISFGTAYANTLATDNVFRLTITAVVLGGSYTHGQVLSNTATAAGTGFSVQSSAVTTTVVIPNPVLTKSNDKPASSTAVRPDEDIEFTLTATNPQGSPATPPRPALYNASIVDTIPSGIIVTTYPTPACALTGSSPTTGGGTLTCAVGTIEPGATVTTSYTGHVAPQSTGSLQYTNSATLTGYSLPDSEQSDPAKKGTYTSTSTSSVRTDNGSLVKTVSPASVPIGGKTTFTVVATIPKDLAYSNAAIIDTLPAGMEYLGTTSVSCAPEGGGADCADTFDPALVSNPSASGSQVSWALGDVTSAEFVREVTVVFTAKVTDVDTNVGRNGTPLTNSVVFTSDGGPSDPATADVTVVEPSLTIAKSVSTPAPVPGAEYTYTVTVTNATGALVGTAYNVTITDTVPAGVIVDESSLGVGGSCTTACDQVNGGGVITWTGIDPIAPSSSVTRTYTAKLKSSLVPQSPSVDYLNTARVPSYTSCAASASSGCVDDGHTYPQVTATAEVTPGTPSADLAIVKTPNGGTTPGSDWTFTLQVSNLGPSDAEGAIVVTDTLPAGLTFVSSGTGWECDQNGQDITCTLEPVDPEPVGLAADEDAAPLTITVRTAGSPSNASYTNVATVESTTTEDPNPGNNTSQATVTVAPIPIPPTPDPDPEKPTDPPVVVPPDPDKPTDPQEPSRPPIAPQIPTKPIKPPTTIEPGQPTTVLPGTVATNAGQKVRVDVSCRPLRMGFDKVALSMAGQWVPSGQVSYCQVRTTKKGKVVVTVTYPGQVLVKIRYWAPKKPGYTAYNKVKRYVVTPR
jgi:uncharacterized repeat protein (TIGR01451 family)/fimbrial isopeptide formation D2 family protein